jgi:hypothetical protein
MTEAEQFHSDLLNKILSWEEDPSFRGNDPNETMSHRRDDKQKLTRSSNLIAGTNPEVTQMLFGDKGVPDNPKEAMMLVRGMDLKTIKNLEIFSVTGLGKKTTAHHILAASSMAALKDMEPKQRYEFYKRLADLEIPHGMDQRGMATIMDNIHKDVAHGGDFTGKKHNVNLSLKPGESGAEFFGRFKESITKQQSMFNDALEHPSTKRLQSAMKGAAVGLEIPDVDLSHLETNPLLKADVTKKLTPVASNVLDSIRNTDLTGADIEQNTQQLVSQIKPNNRLKTPILDMQREQVKALRLGKALPLVGAGAGLLNAGSSFAKGDVAGGLAHTAEAVVGEIPVVGDAVVETVSGSSLGDGTVSGYERERNDNPLHYNKQGPNVPRPGQRERAQQLRQNPNTERGYETITRWVREGVWNKLYQH